MSSQRAEAPIIQHLLAGVSGGLTATISLYPLELLKIRMQVVESAVSPYRSLFSGFSTVVKGEGFLGLYKGVLPACLAASGAWGGYFYFYEHAKKRYMNAYDVPKLGVAAHLLSGVEAGVIIACIFNPLWVIRTRLALQGTVSSEVKYNGLIDTFVKIRREEGIRGLYKGLFPALLLTSHGAIQFAAYEELKVVCAKLRMDPHDQPMLVSMATGGLSKIIASTVTYPYQVVKSRLQQGQVMTVSSTQTLGEDSSSVRKIGVSGAVSATNSSNNSSSSGSLMEGVAKMRVTREYTGTLDCMKKIWRHEGLVGYFRGLVPNLLRVAPSAAITFVTYEECMKMQRNWNVTE